MSFFDALLGKLRYQGLEKELRGFLNFKGAGVTMTPVEGGYDIDIPGGGGGGGSVDAIKDPVKTIARENVVTSGLYVLNGATLQTGDRVVLTEQSSGAQNGIRIAQVGTWTYPDDWTVGSTVKSGCKIVIAGGTYAGSEVVVETNNPITVGTTPISFSFRKLVRVDDQDAVVLRVDGGEPTTGKITNGLIDNGTIALAKLTATGTDGQVVKRVGGVLALANDTGAVPDGSVTTSSTALTSLGNATITRGKKFTAKFEVSGAISGDRTYDWVIQCSGVSDGAGTITLDSVGGTVQVEPFPGNGFLFATSTDTVTIRVYPLLATSTEWRVRGTVEHTS